MKNLEYITNCQSGSNKQLEKLNQNEKLWLWIKPRWQYSYSHHLRLLFPHIKQEIQQEIASGDVVDIYLDTEQGLLVWIDSGIEHYFKIITS